MNTPAINENPSRRAEFHLIAPYARSVEVAADFTKWETFPLDLIHSEGGIWYAVVPLKPGRYSYRFIVDYQWDAGFRAARRMHTGRFATAKAEMDVT
jgi:1,4-alpha-glucan branching enzyme